MEIHLLETTEEKVCSLTKIHSEGSHRMEMQEEKTIRQLQSEVCSWFEKVIPEGKVGVEKKEEEGSVFEEVPL